MTAPCTLPRCDVLVLGAGLAGMRAAWAAKQTRPELDVLLVSPSRAPSGSSFANRNNALGLQAPGEHEAEAFVADALRLAPPGEIDPALVRALAQDAPARLDELLRLGLRFRREPDGVLARFPGCFSPSPRAVVFDGLGQAHAAFLARLRQLGVRRLHGFETLALLRDASGRACGAWLAALRGEALARLEAGTVVAAMGGPAPLFARRICGPGGSGLGLGLLASAGARLVNAPFLQFFWSRARDLAFVNPGDLAWGEALAGLTAARRTHCPLGHGLPDAALDLALLARRDRHGLVRAPDLGLPEPVVLCAHAGNGGARIDARGRSTTPGLFACGECAGGMHGANRMGGGMVLAALVFGARAGETAALEAAEEAAREVTGESASAHGRPPRLVGRDKDAAFLRRLRRDMDAFALPGARRDTPECRAFHERLRRTPEGTRQILLARSALTVLGED